MSKTITIAKDLKDFFNSLSDSQLNKPMYASEEEKPFKTVSSVYIIVEDYLQTDECVELRSDVESNLDKDDSMDNYEIAFHRGTIFLTLTPKTKP